MVVFTVTLITLAFNPTSLIVLGLLAMAWIYLFVVRQSPIVIGGRTFRCLSDPLVQHSPCCKLMLRWGLNVFWACHRAWVGQWLEIVRLVLHLQ